MTTLKATATYFALVFAAGFALGTFRVLVAEPLVGPFNALLMELPVIVTATGFAAQWSVRRFGVPPRVGQRLLMGVIAFVLLQTAEFGFAMALGQSPTAYVARLSTTVGWAGLLAQTFVVLIPLAVDRN